MPSYFPPRLSSFHQDVGHKSESERDQEQHVFITSEPEIAEIHQVVTNHSTHPGVVQPDSPLADLEKYVRTDDPAGPQALPLSVCFKNVTTYGRSLGSSSVKTLGHAVWRTLTMQDIYEPTLKKWLHHRSAADERALIRDFSGVVRNGEMML